MQPLPIMTNELARRLECLVPRGKVDDLNWDGDPSTFEIGQFGQTVAIKVRGQPWRTGVYCFSAEDLPHLEGILAFYATDDINPPFYVAPMGATPQVGAALAVAGFYHESCRQTLTYGVPLESPVPCPAGVSVEPVTHQNIEHAIAVNVEGFEYPQAWCDGIKAAMRRKFDAGALRLFLARHNGEPAGSCCMTVYDDIAALGGTAVVPRLRGHGCQLAMLLHRMHEAHKLGCTLISSGADFGSVCFRNQQRAGLRLAYVESTWRRRQ